MKTLALVLLMAGTAAAQCGISGTRSFVGNGGGVLIQQQQPAGLLGRRTKTRSTLILPIAAQQPVCPPCDNGDDEEHAVQIELLRQIVSTLVEKRQSDELTEESQQNRELLLLILEALRNRDEGVQLLPLPSTSRTTGWRSVAYRVK